MQLRIDLSSLSIFVANKSDRRKLATLRLERIGRMTKNHWLGATTLACASVLTIAVAAEATVLYTYDDLGRVKSITYDDGKRVTYTYDPTGNRTQHVVDVSGNTPPVAVADSEIVYMPTFSNVNSYVLTNDTDADQDLLVVQTVTTPSFGTATISGGGSFVLYAYSGAGPYPVNDSFSYTISDGRGGTATANVSVLINCDPIVCAP